MRRELVIDPPQRCLGPLLRRAPQIQSVWLRPACDCAGGGLGAEASVRQNESPQSRVIAVHAAWGESLSRPVLLHTKFFGRPSPVRSCTYVESIAGQVQP